MVKDPAEIALGPIFIGVLFNIALYGVMATQVYLYFNNYKTDRMWLKCLVIFLFLADSVNAVFDLIYVYDALIIHFGDVEYLTKANWVFGTNAATTGIISSSVQLFYAWRVKVVTGNMWIVLFIVVCAIIDLLAAIGTSIAISILPVFADAVKYKAVVIIWLVATAVTDVCITISLTYHLQKHKTGIPATDDVVNRIIRLTVQTGAITSVWAIMNLIVCLAKSSGVHLLFNVSLSKLYTNSLMSTLNARGSWKNSTDVICGNRNTVVAKSDPAMQFRSLGPTQETTIDHSCLTSQCITKQIHNSKMWKDSESDIKDNSIESTV